MAAKSFVPQLKLPTGYEIPMGSVERKRKLAELMLQQGMDPLQGATSWLQPLGRIAKVWAGKSMDRDAEKEQADIYSSMTQSYQEKVDEFNKDLEEVLADPNKVPAVAAKWNGDSMLGERVKPLVEAMATRLREGQEGMWVNGRWARKGSVPVGTVDAGKPTDLVHRTQDGGLRINDIAVAANRSVGGFGIEGMPSVGPDPGAMPQPQATAPQTTSPSDTAIVGKVVMEQAARGEPIRPPHGVIQGIPYWEINGVRYDNPEGK